MTIEQLQTLLELTIEEWDKEHQIIKGYERLNPYRQLRIQDLIHLAVATKELLADWDKMKDSSQMNPYLQCLQKTLKELEKLSTREEDQQKSVELVTVFLRECEKEEYSPTQIFSALCATFSFLIKNFEVPRDAALNIVSTIKLLQDKEESKEQENEIKEALAFALLNAAEHHEALILIESMLDTSLRRLTLTAQKFLYMIRSQEYQGKQELEMIFKTAEQWLKENEGQDATNSM